MDRCPHCATPHPTRPRCRLCGGEVAAPAVAPAPLRDLDPTRGPDVDAVANARLPDLETTEEALGDTRIPNDSTSREEGGAVPTSCPRCGAAAVAGRFCDRCGTALYAAVPGASDGEPPLLRCLACGVPNRPGATRCAACGERLE